MMSLTIGLDFVTGRSVAAQVADRDAAEWPPHPGRVFMALAAACFEMGEEQAEVAALKWLENLPPPNIYASEAEERSRISVYVPVNDKVKASKSLLQSVPGLSRSKQERSFPTVIPHDPVVLLEWNIAPNVAKHINAISSICAKVIRVGHSSSLVRVWVEAKAIDTNLPCWRPTQVRSELRVRVAGAGEFQRLRVACNADRIEQFAELAGQIETSKGKEKKEAKTAFESAFGEPYKSSSRAPEATPPVLGLWQGYARDRAYDESDVIEEGQHFDSQLLILGKLEGRSLGVQDTLALTRRLRDAAMIRCNVQPPPAWLGGHEPDGEATQRPHVAFIALPYVGGPYADGHVMGMALALPKHIPPEERGRLLQPLLVNDEGEPCDVELKLGKLGEWTVQLEERDAPPKSLQNSTWVGPSHAWASVTPVILDRFPKSPRADDRAAWNEEVSATIALSCKHAGLPEPAEIDIDTTSWHEGVPRALKKSRPIRNPRSQRDSHPSTTLIGDGFPVMPARSGKPSRPQVHVYLRFKCAVCGPVILGAGRFLGYGLCKPLISRRQHK